MSPAARRDCVSSSIRVRRRRRFVGDPRPIDGQREVGVSHLHRQHQIQSRLHQAFGGGIRGETRGGDPRRALPQHFDRPLQGRLELFRTDGKEEREDRIGQQAGFEEIRAREAKLAQADLKGGVVPQCQRHGFFLRHSIVQRDASGDSRGRLRAGARRRARAFPDPLRRSLRIDCRVRRAGGGESRAEGD